MALNASSAGTPGPPEPPPKSRLEALLPFTTIAVILAALYVAWIFYSRYESNRRAQEAIQQRQAEARKSVVQTVFGSGEIKFSTFGADSGVLKPGETTELCYGVENATTVKIDPPVGETKPSYHHCIEIAPKKTTTYTITAQDSKGNSKSESITIQVR